MRLIVSLILHICPCRVPWLHAWLYMHVVEMLGMWVMNHVSGHKNGNKYLIVLPLCSLFYPVLPSYLFSRPLCSLSSAVLSVLSVLPSSLFSQFCCPLCSPILSVLLSSLFSQFCCPLCSLSSPVLSVLSVLPSSQSSQFCRPLNFPVLSVLSVLLFSLHCKNIWVALTIFWLSQLHTCYVRDTL